MARIAKGELKQILRNGAEEEKEELGVYCQCVSDSAGSLGY